MDKKFLKGHKFLTEFFAVDLIESLLQKNIISIQPFHFSYHSKLVHNSPIIEKKGFVPNENVIYFGNLSTAIEYRGIALDTQKTVYYTRLRFVNPMPDPDFNILLSGLQQATANWTGTVAEVYRTIPKTVNNNDILLFTDIITETGYFVYDTTTAVITDVAGGIVQQHFNINSQFNGFRILLS
ncbi:MAG: hypothetical protein WBJ10_12525 [Daejeonella sp.]|uniref:hypothetical protein n=1 Tax=Daejeonella sp. TaxID=2805397 RepID=UPI003C70FB3E